MIDILGSPENNAYQFSNLFANQSNSVYVLLGVLILVDDLLSNVYCPLNEYNGNKSCVIKIHAAS